MSDLVGNPEDRFSRVAALIRTVLRLQLASRDHCPMKLSLTKQLKNAKQKLQYHTLSNVDDGDTVPTPVTTVLSLQNLMDANKFLVLFNVI